ncbi:MAG TPA: tetratricopeptide repeat protein [Pyrinomonadaceae bacterium]|nr:tetratricopeptide repeat protein [Pyrinomonadaceae bacterium]
MSLFFSACGSTAGGNANANNANTAVVEVPQYPDAQTAFAEGTKFFESGREGMAIEALKQAVAFDPDMAEAHFKLGMAYSILDKEKDAEASFEAAVEAYKKLLKNDPENAQAQFNLGRSYNKLNKDEDAEDALRRAVKLKPDDSGYQTEMGAILIKLAKYPEAIGFLKKALELDSENPRAEDLMERAEDGRRRVEQGIPAGTNTNSKANSNRPANANTNGAVESNKPANAPPPPPANKKPEVRPTVITIPPKPAAKPPERKP